MKRYMLLPAALLLALAVAGCSGDNPATPTDAAADPAKRADGSHGMATYTITLENLTPATGPGSSQPFSPPILASHRPDMHVFRVGQAASAVLAGVAEDAQNGPLVDELHASPRVHDVAVGDQVVLPGEAMTFTLTAARSSRRLSAIFMLVNTNDAFGGLDGVRLPGHGELTYLIPAYDAGSELNTELETDIPGPCCIGAGMGTPEQGVIMLHEGILGVADLDPATWGWDGPAARLTVRRVD